MKTSNLFVLLLLCSAANNTQATKDAARVAREAFRAQQNERAAEVKQKIDDIAKIIKEHKENTLAREKAIQAHNTATQNLHKALELTTRSPQKLEALIHQLNELKQKHKDIYATMTPEELGNIPTEMSLMPLLLKKIQAQEAELSEHTWKKELKKFAMGATVLVITLGTAQYYEIIPTQQKR